MHRLIWQTPTHDPIVTCIWLYNPMAQPYHLVNELVVKEVNSLDEIDGDYYLQLDADEEYQLCDKRKRHQPLTIDFSHAYYRYRGGTEWLPKAFKGLAGATVADVTAGWGRDSWLLAYRGFVVTMVERNPYLQVLLRQGLSHAQHDTVIGEVAQRLSLRTGDANEFLMDNAMPIYDVIYLDPMYPNRRKKAKVKKDMQALHQLLGGEEQDAEQLLQTALDVARKRVVVKRPKGAPVFNEKNVSFSIAAPNTRFDVYVCQ